MSEIRHAIIMAAGRGMRMAPLTDAIPKPMAPYNGTTLIARGISRLAERIKYIHVTVGYKNTGEIDEATSLWTEAKDLYAKADVKAGVNECENRLAGLGRRRREQSRTDG